MGCNNGAKNTLDHTYLSAAKHAGADIRTRHEVKGFRPLDGDDGGGYEVTYVVHTGADGEPAVDLPLRTIRARRLVLAAGTFGTTYLLLRNRLALPGLSGALGTRFTGNGDLLGLVMDSSRDGLARDLGANTGPVITTAIRVGDEADGDGTVGRGHYLEDAGYPAFAAWLAETGKGLGTLARAFQFGYRRAVEDMLDAGDSTVGADLAEMIGPGNLSATSLPLLGMGRDIPDGVMRLVGGRLEVDWTIETSIDYFEGVRNTMRTHRGPARRHLLRQPGLVGQARDHRAPARRRPDGAAPGRGPLRPVRRGVRPPRSLRDGRRAAARPGRRQPVADHRGRRRPCLHPPAR